MGRSLNVLVVHRVRRGTSDIDPLEICAHHIKPQEPSVGLIGRNSQIEMFHLANALDAAIDLSVSNSTSDVHPQQNRRLTTVAHRSESRW
jgi:hypothetical protein